MPEIRWQHDSVICKNSNRTPTNTDILCAKTKIENTNTVRRMWAKGERRRSATSERVSCGMTYCFEMMMAYKYVTDVVFACKRFECDL